MRLKYSRRKRFPLPTFFTFVFTDAMGSHLYAACLRFYELVPHEQAVAILMAIYGTDMVGMFSLTLSACYSPILWIDSLFLTIYKHYETYINSVITLLTADRLLKFLKMLVCTVPRSSV